MSTSKRVHAASGLFSETADGPRLLGSKCASCGTPYFPRSEICHNPDCEKTQMEDASFGPRGRIWTLAPHRNPSRDPTGRITRRGQRGVRRTGSSFMECTTGLWTPATL